MDISTKVEIWPIAGRFTIARGSRTQAEVIVAEVSRDGIIGRGECVAYSRYGETRDSVIDAIHAVPTSNLTNATLQSILPAGAARNALDCALWDFAAKSCGERVWRMLRYPPPRRVLSAYTISLEDPATMRQAAAAHADYPLLKVKLGADGDIDRVAAVRNGAPDSRLIVDANEGWSVDEYPKLVAELHALGVAMIEQPLPSHEDQALAELPRPVPICADESCRDRDSLTKLIGRYDMINIKLDKTGGLTEALALRQAAKEAGLKIMVGCMVSTSLSMAPAALVAQEADVVDLDGPLLLECDRSHAIVYENGWMQAPNPELWG